MNGYTIEDRFCTYDDISITVSPNDLDIFVFDPNSPDKTLTLFAATNADVPDVDYTFVFTLSTGSSVETHSFTVSYTHTCAGANSVKISHNLGEYETYTY